MNHQKSNKKLNRNTSRRKALFRSLLLSLFLHEEIKTTLTKAKLVKRMADSLISKAKGGTLSIRRQIFSFLPNKKVVNKLINEIAPKFTENKGGFTKLVRIKNRRGDNTIMAKVELLKKTQSDKAKVEKDKKAGQ